MGHPILARLHDRDRALFLRWCLAPAHRGPARRAWTALTHAGGATMTIGSTTLPHLVPGAGATLRAAAWRAFLILALSHLFVQAIKRLVGRPRPSVAAVGVALIGEPDRFSFPSGHATAAMAVALGYAWSWPGLAPLLLPAAGLIGLSRVVLGVHYPGDVLVGQLLALLAGVAIVTLGG